MLLGPPPRLSTVHGLTPEQDAAIRGFLQGAAYVREMDATRRGQWYAARDLVGGFGGDWRGTPLIALYEKHARAGKSHDEAVDAAGIDVGHIFKAVQHADKRQYETERRPDARYYRLAADAPAS